MNDLVQVPCEHLWRLFCGVLARRRRLLLAFPAAFVLPQSRIGLALVLVLALCPCPCMSPLPGLFCASFRVGSSAAAQWHAVCVCVCVCVCVWCRGSTANSAIIKVGDGTRGSCVKFKSGSCAVSRLTCCWCSAAAIPPQACCWSCTSNCSSTAIMSSRDWFGRAWVLWLWASSLFGYIIMLAALCVSLHSLVLRRGNSN